jgi:hypothetical protein
MDNEVISHAESGEKILTFDVPDDALERAAKPEEKAFTAVYCTRALYFDCGWPTVENGWTSGRLRYAAWIDCVTLAAIGRRFRMNELEVSGVYEFWGLALEPPLMDAAYFREKAAICARLASGLSWNNPGRQKLLELAEDFERRAAELEAAERRSNNEGRSWSRVAQSLPHD